MIIRRGSKFYSVFFQKCPRCQEGDLFQNKWYSRSFAAMNTTCSKCKLDFIQEPSFYFGAMYFSYIVQVALFVIIYLVLNYGYDDPPSWVYITFMIVIPIAILPLNYRWSRAAWFNLFVSFEEEKK